MRILLIHVFLFMENSLTSAVISEPLLRTVDHPDVFEIISGDEGLMLYHPLSRRTNQIFKRVFDLLISSVLILLVLSWVVPVIGLLIKISSGGPVFFLQKRNKRGGRLFTCIKFRTMVVNLLADELPATEHDVRITPLGRILRKHHLDELPQLLNVWWGDMSLIGPRPHMVSDNIRFAAIMQTWQARHRVKPGITGLAQVLGFSGNVSGSENLKARAEKDLYYIHHWTLLMDIRIVISTVFRILGKGVKGG